MLRAVGARHFILMAVPPTLAFSCLGWVLAQRHRGEPSSRVGVVAHTLAFHHEGPSFLSGVVSRGAEAWAEEWV